MQNIVLDEPYEFVPPYNGRLWIKLLQPFLQRYLDKKYGITHVECRNVERLEQSLADGQGILLAPNHPRPSDPIVMASLSAEVRQPVFTMAASWLFMQSRFQCWLLRRMGAFSVYREGLDRSAVSTAIEILTTARRPLVIFPEGTITRSNDVLFDLMDGTVFIARQAAKRRGKSEAGKVVIHPVAIKYVFHGDVEDSVSRVLTDIEARLTWRPQCDLPVVQRVYKVGGALLGLKETEYLGQPQTGTIPQRVAGLIDHLLSPLEAEWAGGGSDGNVVTRVKRLRTAIIPELVTDELSDEERERRWHQLAKLYLAQQLSCYPDDYVRSRPVAERLLETVERFDEDLTDVARIHRPMTALVQVGEPLTVNPRRPPKGTPDLLLKGLQAQLTSMLATLGDEVHSIRRPTPG